MKTPKQPQPPDPYKTAGAQTATNIGTSIANTLQGQVNQYDPNGSLTYNIRGHYPYVDPNSGATHMIPLFDARTNLSRDGQEIFNSTTASQKALAATAEERSKWLKDYLSSAGEIDTTDVEGRLTDLARKRIDPQYARDEEALRTRLINTGAREGSDIWNNEMRRFTEAKNDAYNQLYLTGRGQAYSEAANERARPLNEVIGLLSGSQVNVPQYGISSPAGIPTTDIAGLINQNYNQKLGIYDRQMQGHNQMMGGLFGLGGGLLRAGMGFF